MTTFTAEVEAAFPCEGCGMERGHAQHCDAYYRDNAQQLAAAVALRVEMECRERARICSCGPQFGRPSALCPDCKGTGIEWSAR